MTVTTMAACLPDGVHAHASPLCQSQSALRASDSGSPALRAITAGTLPETAWRRRPRRALFLLILTVSRYWIRPLCRDGSPTSDQAPLRRLGPIAALWRGRGRAAQPEVRRFSAFQTAANRVPSNSLMLRTRPPAVLLSHRSGQPYRRTVARTTDWLEDTRSSPTGGPRDRT